MELRQLRNFVCIVDLASLSRAAGALHIAQSALSQQVAALEREFRTPLLHRMSRGVQPTDAGKELYRHAQALLQHAETAKEAVASCSAEPAGVVGIGVPLSLAATLALPIFEAVRSQHPGIKLQVHEELSGTVLERVKNGRLTLGIAFDDGDLEGLQARRVLEERLFLVLHPKSPLARRKAVGLREIAGMDLVIPSAGQGVRVRIEQAMAQAGLSLSKVAAEINSQTLMKQAAAAGFGATILAWPSVESEVAQGKLAAVEISRPAITRVAAICVSASMPRTRATECVLAAATEAIRQTVRRATHWRGVRFLDGE
jgi:LysR family transcriptional regulator, nitrogen assimilation regulatory protein